MSRLNNRVTLYDQGHTKQTQQDNNDYIIGVIETFYMVKWLVVACAYFLFLVHITTIVMLLCSFLFLLNLYILFSSASTVSFSYSVVTMNFNSHTTNKILFAYRLKPDLDHSIFLPTCLSSIKYDPG